MPGWSRRCRSGRPHEAGVGSAPMRLALVSPYSWTYPGGVNRHIEGLATEFLDGGHDVRALAPHDGDVADAPEWLAPRGPSPPAPVQGPRPPPRAPPRRGEAR